MLGSMVTPGDGSLEGCGEGSGDGLTDAGAGVAVGDSVGLWVGVSDGDDDGTTEGEGSADRLGPWTGTTMTLPPLVMTISLSDGDWITERGVSARVSSWPRPSSIGAQS